MVGSTPPTAEQLNPRPWAMVAVCIDDKCATKKLVVSPMSDTSHTRPGGAPCTAGSFSVSSIRRGSVRFVECLDCKTWHWNAEVLGSDPGSKRYVVSCACPRA